MAADPRITNAVASAAADAIVDLIDTGGAGSMVFYDGTIPTNADTAIGAQVALSTVTFSATAFGAASDGVATAATITGSTAGVAGTAEFARILNGSAATIMDVTVGVAGEDVNFNSNVFSVGASVDVTALTVTVPKT